MSQASVSTEIAKTKKSVNPLLIMLVLFGLPYFISWYSYYTGDTLFFKQGKSNGQLISPVRAFPDFSLKDINGELITRQQFVGKWTLLLTGPSSCNETCLERLWTMRQVRLALSVDRQRVQRFFLTKETAQYDALKSLLGTDHRGLRVFAVDNAAEGQSLLKTLQPDGELQEFSLYIVDPLANVMMYYPPTIDGKKVLKDMERLIKFSKVGEKT